MDLRQDVELCGAQATRPQGVVVELSDGTRGLSEGGADTVRFGWRGVHVYTCNIPAAGCCGKTCPALLCGKHESSRLVTTQPGRSCSQGRATGECITIRTDKQLIWVRLDREVWEWLKSYGEGYSSRLNGILRTVIENPRRGA